MPNFGCSINKRKLKEKKEKLRRKRKR